MPTYVTLYKWTEQGIKNVKESPERIEKNIKAAEQMGGKLIGVYITMGDYDLVAISEWPNDEAASAMVLTQGAQGYARTKSMKAYTVDEFKEVVKKMP
jgi:uncharacterized protein with GYD domain